MIKFDSSLRDKNWSISACISIQSDQIIIVFFIYLANFKKDFFFYDYHLSQVMKKPDFYIFQKE